MAMDLAELGVIFVAEGAEAAIAKMEEFKDASASVVQTEEERVKAAGKVATATEALSAQITRSIISYKGAQSAQYEFAAIAMGANEQILKQIELLKTLEESEHYATQTAKELSQERRKEEGLLLDIARDTEYLNKVRQKEAADAKAAAEAELAARQKYYDDIVAKAKKAEQAITDARHKSIIDAQDATARAAAMYQKDENERVKAAEKAAAAIAAANQRAATQAATQAEQQAMSEIAWAKKSRDEQIRIKSEIQVYKSAGVSDSTIANKFGPGAFTGAIKEAETFSEKLENVRLNTSRVRTEAVVVAHEMVQGRFSRIPATLMVFAEYSDLSAVAMSGLGLAAMGLVAAMVGVSIAMVKGVLEQRDLQNALILTGNFAGTTEGSLNAIAHSAVAMGGSIATAKGIILELASSGKFTANQINAVTTAVVAMEHATGDGEDSVKRLVNEFKSLQVEANAHSRYSDEVTKAVLKLDAQYHFLTTSVLAQIRALEDEGKVKEASALATEAFAKETEARAAQIVANLGNIEMGWRHIKEAIGNAWSAMKDWGKVDSAQARSDVAAKKVEELSKPFTGTDPVYDRAGKLAAANEELRQSQLELMRANDRAFEQGQKAATQSEANRALADIEIEGNQLKVDKLNKLDVALERYRNNLDKLRAQGETAETSKQLRPDVIAAHEAALAEKFKEKKTPAEHLDAYDKLINKIKLFSQATDDMTESSLKQTAAEKFHNRAIMEADVALKLHKITKQEYLSVLKEIEQQTSRRENADKQVANAKAAAIADKKAADSLERLNKILERNATTLRAATHASEDYIKSLKNQASIAIEGRGKGSDWREEQVALNQKEFELNKKKTQLERESAGEGKGPTWLKERVDVAEATYNKEVEIYKSTRRKMKEMDKDWTVGAKEAYANYLTDIGHVAKNTESMFTKAFKGMEDSMVNFVKTGKLDFASLADSIVSDLIRIQVQQSMMPGIAGAMSGAESFVASLFAANGHSFDSSGVQGFANGGAFHNSVLTSTTPFMFASGGGFAPAVAGEAGPEAVMPLTRGANGKLGVQSSGGSGNNVVVNIIESPGNGGKQERRTDNGNDVLDVFVEKIKNSIAGDISKGAGSVPSAMSRTYGLNRVAGAY